MSLEALSALYYETSQTRTTLNFLTAAPHCSSTTNGK